MIICAPFFYKAARFYNYIVANVIKKVAKIIVI